MLKSKLILTALVAFACFAHSGCTSIPGQPAEAPAKEINYDLIATASRVVVKSAVKLTLDNNPRYTASIAAINTSVAVLFSGTPTTALVTAQVTALAPDLKPADVATLATAVIDAYDLYSSATGRTVLIPTDANVAKIVAAITTGISEGIALHNAGVSP